MKYHAAYALLVLGGNTHPTAVDIEKVLTAAGIKAEDGKAAGLATAFQGKDYHTAVAEGLVKLGSSSGSSSGTSAPKAAAPAEVKKVEAVVVEEEVDLDGAMDMFGY